MPSTTWRRTVPHLIVVSRAELRVAAAESVRVTSNRELASPWVQLDPSSLATGIPRTNGNDGKHHDRANPTYCRAVSSVLRALKRRVPHVDGPGIGRSVPLEARP